MPHGGDLTIKAYTETASGKIYLFIEFQDTGEGISEESLKKLFMPYYSTKKKGTGLGLSIVERIIQEHEGSIKVESTVGKGSKFILKFPIEVKI